MQDNQKQRLAWSAEIRAAYRPITIDSDRLEEGLPAACGNNFRLLRSEHRWTQAEAAGVMKVSVSQYRKYERGEDAPKFIRMIDYCMATGAPLAFFYCRSAYMRYLGEHQARIIELPISLFCGSASQTEFAAFAWQLSSRFGRAVQVPARTLRGSDPFRAVAEPEAGEYGSHVARGLRFLREVLALTQEEMASAMNLAVRTYNQYERYSSPPWFCVNHAMRLWAATGIPPEWLLCGTPCFDRFRLQQERVLQVREWLRGSNEDDWQYALHIARRNRRQVTEAPVHRPKPASVVSRS